MITGTLFKQLPKPKKVGIKGVLTGDERGMYWWTDPTDDNGHVQASIFNYRIFKISSKGIHVVGYEDQSAKHGSMIRCYQEWNIIFK